MNKLSNLGLPESNVSSKNVKIVSYKEGQGYECLVDGIPVLINNGNYHDRLGEHTIFGWDDIIKEYHGSEIREIINSYNEKTGYYECTINGETVYVDKYGNYTDSRQNMCQVGNWEYIRSQYKAYDMGKVKVKTQPAIVKAIAGTPAKYNQVRQSSGSSVSSGGNYRGGVGESWIQKHEEEQDRKADEYAKRQEIQPDNN